MTALHLAPLTRPRDEKIAYGVGYLWGSMAPLFLSRVFFWQGSGFPFAQNGLPK